MSEPTHDTIAPTVSRPLAVLRSGITPRALVVGLACMACLVCLWSAQAEPWGHDIVVSAHWHTTYSDGSVAPEAALRRARACGASKVILADHAELINLAPGQRHRHGRHWKLSGLAKWKEEVRRLGPDLVPGVEVAFGGRHRGSHVLYLGGRLDAYDAVAEIAEAARSADARGRPTPSAEHPAFQLRRLAEESGAVVIAAHPQMDNVLTSRSPRYRLPLDCVMGLEFLNTGILDGALDTFQLFSRFAAAKSVPLIAMAGTDYHWELQPSPPWRTPRWRYYTIVQTDSPTPTGQEVIESMRRARCYAAFRNARIGTMSAAPGRTFRARADRYLFYVELEGMDGNIGRTCYAQAISRSGRVVGPQRLRERLVSGHNRVVINLKGLLQPDRGNDGWFLYLMFGDQVITSGIEVTPFGASRGRPS